jgi:hypothetical protein
MIVAGQIPALYKETEMNKTMLKKYGKNATTADGLDGVPGTPLGATKRVPRSERARGETAGGSNG